MKVKVFSTPSCPYCVTLNEFLKEHNIEFVDIDVSQNKVASDEMIEKSGQMGVPVIDIDGEIVVGFDNNNYASITHPPLTSVQVPKIELGVEAIRLLVSRIENPQQIHQTRIVPVELIIRESSLKL